MTEPTKFVCPACRTDLLFRGKEKCYSCSTCNTEFPVMANILYRLYAIIAIIMLLNMLIAILSDSYTEIIVEAEKEWKIERAKLIVALMDNLLSYKNKYTTVENIEYLISLEPDNIPIKGIENFELEFLKDN